jgi:hypothetical protein
VAGADLGNGTVQFRLAPTESGASVLTVLGPQGLSVATSPLTVLVMAVGATLPYACRSAAIAC